MMLLSALVLATSATTSCVSAPLPPSPSFSRAVAALPVGGPHAMPVLHTEGTLPHTGIHDQSAAAMQDFDHMLTLAQAWRATGDRQALARLSDYFDAWTSVYHPSFDPIDETGLDKFIAAYRLSSASLPPEIERGARDFLGQIAHGYLDRMDAHRSDRHGTWSNNWQSHRVKLATLAALALGDKNLIDRARRAFAEQISINMKPDGEVIDFAERDALHYVVYDLEPLTLAALAAHSHGENWLTMQGADGQTLAAGLDWLRPYATRQLRHEEFVNSSVKFDAQRAAAGLPGYSGQWDPATAKALYWSASLLDPRYAVVARGLSASPPSWLWAYAQTCPARG